MALSADQLAQIQANQSNAEQPTPTATALQTGTTAYSPLLIEQQINQYIEANQQLDQLTFPQDLPENGPFINIQIGTYSRSGLQVTGAIDYNRKIKLPIPNALVDSHQVAYEQKELGATVGAAVQGLTGFKGQPASPTSQAQSSTLQQVTSGITQGLAGATGFDGVAGAASALTGLAINDYLTILFKGPTYKKFDFEWLLSARNAQESAVIYNIIMTLNNAMAPSLGIGSFIFGYPDIFLCSFSDKVRDSMYEFKPAVLENFQVNWLGSGTPAFYNTGDPESVVIHASFLQVQDQRLMVVAVIRYQTYSLTESVRNE
jgi:hypothetical protein